MTDSNFEGSLVLEKLAAIDKVDEFYSAVDSDDFAKARVLLKQAGVDPKSIAIVLQKMTLAED